MLKVLRWTEPWFAGVQFCLEMPGEHESNRALDFIVASYADRPETTHLVKVLPSLAVALYSEAEQHARRLTEPQIGPDRRRLLAECILDLELFGGFDAAVEYTGDGGLASCYIDAVLFEATGKEASVEPTEAQYRDEGTHMCRGIAKYVKAEDYCKMPDPVGWLFGKEYSAILADSAKNFAYVAAVLPRSLAFRLDGRWRMRYALTGEVPSQSEQDAACAMLERA